MVGRVRALPPRSSPSPATKERERDGERDGERVVPLDGIVHLLLPKRASPPLPSPPLHFMEEREFCHWYLFDRDVLLAREAFLRYA